MPWRRCWMVWPTRQAARRDRVSSGVFAGALQPVFPLVPQVPRTFLVATRHARIGLPGGISSIRHSIETRSLKPPVWMLY
jgi:hypothetical protein